MYAGNLGEWSAALMAGTKLAIAPLSTAYDLYATARIQVFDAEPDIWLPVLMEQPGILSVGDGDPHTVAVPDDLSPWLAGTLDTAQCGDRERARYRDQRGVGRLHDGFGTP